MGCVTVKQPQVHVMYPTHEDDSSFRAQTGAPFDLTQAITAYFRW